MGEPPEVEVRPGTAVAIADGRAAAAGRRRRVKIEHTQAAAAGQLEILRPATPGEGMVARTRTPPRAPSWCRPGARCAPRTSACSPRPD